MPDIDWERVCGSINVDYTKTAASKARGYINIRCPLCRDSDQGHHLGLHRSGGWSCFRSPVGHRGRDPRRIVALLLGCSVEMAGEILQSGETDALSDFDEAALSFLTADGGKATLPKLTMPTEFRSLKSSHGRARLYWEYLLSRGFTSQNLKKIRRRYNIHYCDSGPWRGRIILPIYIEGELVSWTGRTVYDTEDLRYKSLSHQMTASPRGRCNVRDVLYNFDNATHKRSHTCVLVEGPFDVLKVDYYGHGYGITAIATFGSRIRLEQLGLLDKIRNMCGRIVVCGDRNAEANVMDLLSATRDFGTQSIQLPDGVEDPGDLNKHQVRTLFRSQ